ncbi:hypothetical protein B7R25_00050 [Subtercola boreus]|uniref:Zinc finger DksA/TraR C4-type domain-containing protein n=1 Tax=Subtercola boreus TaxID=120213 RepID=A0A3E0WEL1_9MICO|nr:hypothetical protein B7R24_00055 [Subtercola boreus]RFA24069.1 hypothetical protein B7R23_00055 [Subtercola boreus]RFA29770.1 hypothetical protein B7R25_00050 [Subtercola boreus]
MTDDRLAHLRRELERLRSELDTELKRMTGSLDDVRDARGDASADDEHDPEGPTLSSEWSRIAGVTAELQARSTAIDGALERFERGTYGTCIRCGLPIDAGRLDARPFAELCITCARRG